jgi:hypothetical protein
MLREPLSPQPNWPRYSHLPFPPYRFVPGLNPHPINHPDGHSYRKIEKPLPAWHASAWRTLAPYLYGIDLYNYAYWWECHESLEGLWVTAGKHTPHARFVQGLIQVAGANLQWHRGKSLPARSLAKKGIGWIEFGAGSAEVYMGIPITPFIGNVRAYFQGQREIPALIPLEM